VHPRPAYARNAALLAARLVLGTIMFAHGYQKLMVDGIGRTTQGFEHMSIPVAIVSASFVTVVEVAGGVLLMAGLLVPVVAALEGFVMVGAAGYVHLPHGVFVANGGWELVGAIGAGLAALAASGPGRWNVAHLLSARGARRELAAPRPPTAAAHPPEPVPPAGLPLVPVVRLDPAPGPAVFPTRSHRRARTDATGRYEGHPPIR
jgi:putative oxidoreductase